MSGVASQRFDEFAEACMEVVYSDDPKLLTDIRQRFPEFADQLEDQVLGLRLLLSTVRPKPGDQLLKYRLDKEIAKGGMSQIFLSSCEGSEKQFAIKVLTLPFLDEKSLADRFQMETNIMASLKHEHIIPVLDHGAQSGWTWLAMPYITGQSLAKRISSSESKPANWDDFRSIAKLGADVASGLTHAHENGVVHRDIKPGNLILDENGKVWISDFGLAKSFLVESGFSFAGDIVGTPRYMAPEQFRGYADERSDIYSLGVTLWELATGRKANELHKKSRPRSNTESTTIPPLQTINPKAPIEFAEVIDTACAFDASHRFLSATEFETALRCVSQGKRSNSDAVKKSRSRLRKSSDQKHWLVQWPIQCLVAALAFLGITLGVMTLRGLGNSEPSIPDSVRILKQIPDSCRITENTRQVLDLANFGGGSLNDLRVDGPDRNLFELDTRKRTLAFKFAPDFEYPNSGEGSNVYQVTLVLENTSQAKRTKRLEIEVLNVDEPIKLPHVNEAQPPVVTMYESEAAKSLASLGPRDPEQLPWSARITGGKDQHRFSVCCNQLVAMHAPPRLEPYEVTVEFHDEATFNDLAISTDKATNSSYLHEVGRLDFRPLVVSNSRLNPQWIRGANALSSGKLYVVQASDDSVELWELTSTDSHVFDSKIISEDCGLPPGVEAIASRNGVDFVVLGVEKTPHNDTQNDIHESRFIWKAKLENGSFLLGEKKPALSLLPHVNGAKFISEDIIAVSYSLVGSYAMLLDINTGEILGRVELGSTLQMRCWTQWNPLKPIRPGTSLDVHITVVDSPVVLYSEKDFQGDQQPLNPGTYNYEEIVNWKVGNDDLSSFRVKQGFQIEISEHNFGVGLRYKHTNSVADLQHFDNQASWIRIRRIHDEK